MRFRLVESRQGNDSEEHRRRDAETFRLEFERQSRRRQELLADGRRRTAEMRQDRALRLAMLPFYGSTTEQVAFLSTETPQGEDVEEGMLGGDIVDGIDIDNEEGEEDNDNNFDERDGQPQRNVISNASAFSNKVISGIKAGFLSPFRKNRLDWKPIYEGEKRREHSLLYVISRYNESVDGGYLSPFRYNKICKIDYSIPMVRSLIIGRKLAPFYIPMEDYNNDWPRNKIIEKVDELSLHERYADLPPEHPLVQEIEKTSHLPVDDLKRDSIGKEIDKNLPFMEQRALRFKIFNARLIRNRIKLQERETNILTDNEVKSSAKKSILDKYLPNDNLKYEIYKDVEECPICFMNIPKPLNKTKCCHQSLCTECFVSIRRAGERLTRIQRTLTNITSQRENDRRGGNGLVIPDLETPGVFYRVTLDISSQPTKCPYCTCEDFAVVYEPPKTRRTGIGGTPPALFVPNQVPKLTESRKSIVSDLDKVKFVRSEDIRPQWKHSSKTSRNNQFRLYNERIIIASLLTSMQNSERSATRLGSPPPDIGRPDDIPVNNIESNNNTNDNEDNYDNEEEVIQPESNNNELENVIVRNTITISRNSNDNKRPAVNTAAEGISEHA